MMQNDRSLQHFIFFCDFSEPKFKFKFWYFHGMPDWPKPSCKVKMETRDGVSGPLVVVCAAVMHLSVLRFIPFQSFVFNFFDYVDFYSEKF